MDFIKKCKSYSYAKKITNHAKKSPSFLTYFAKNHQLCKKRPFIQKKDHLCKKITIYAKKVPIMQKKFHNYAKKVSPDHLITFFD